MADEGVSKIGRYQVVGKLTTGGMAEIYLGRLTGPHGFEKPVVIKRILGHLTSPTFSEMFLDEARIVADIRHPNVVQVFDFGEDTGQLFMAMEYLEGESLGGILRRLWATDRRLKPEAAALIAAAACAGLHAAHELKDRHGRPLGLVHRDVSPSNLFVTYDGHVKVIDFGVAKARGTEGRTDAGQVRGKSAYMSPEQALARGVDRRSDIFSLGIVLFEMCTMRRLFQRENPLLVYRAICEEPIPSMTDAMSSIPPELAQIASRALERSPDARYPTAQALRLDLLAAARRLTSAEPEEVLGETMRELFADRMAQKHALRWGLEHGEPFEELPEAETDLGATIPSLALGGRYSKGTASARSRSRLVAIAVAGGVVATALAAVSFSRAPRNGAESAVAPVVAPPAPGAAVLHERTVEVAHSHPTSSAPAVSSGRVSRTATNTPTLVEDRPKKTKSPAAKPAPPTPSAPAPPASASGQPAAFRRFD
jgi:serine/threonine-protein kinase